MNLTGTITGVLKDFDGRVVISLAVNENAPEMVLTPEKTIELQSFNKLNRER